jgi:hypothetical protein
VKRDTISRFNRDTIWLTMGLLGTVAFAALILAFQECQPKASLNGNPAPVESFKSGGKITPGTGRGDDHTFAETSLLEAPSSAPTPAPVLAFTSRINRQDPAPERRPRTRNVKNRAMGLGTVDVKRRLIELWHRSLAQDDKPRSWTAFSNLRRGARKKAAYTAETGH